MKNFSGVEKRLEDSRDEVRLLALEVLAATLPASAGGRSGQEEVVAAFLGDLGQTVLVHMDDDSPQLRAKALGAFQDTDFDLILSRDFPPFTEVVKVIAGLDGSAVSKAVEAGLSEHVHREEAEELVTALEGLGVTEEERVDTGSE